MGCPNNILNTFLENPITANQFITNNKKIKNFNCFVIIKLKINISIKNLDVKGNPKKKIKDKKKKQENVGIVWIKPVIWVTILVLNLLIKISVIKKNNVDNKQWTIIKIEVIISLNSLFHKIGKNRKFISCTVV